MGEGRDALILHHHHTFSELQLHPGLGHCGGCVLTQHKGVMNNYTNVISMFLLSWVSENRI